MFSLFSPAPVPPVCTRKGFALVISLSLMALVLLLLVTLTSLIGVETRQAGDATQQVRAKQNALLGLQIAIGELQEHTGVDQVATGTTEYIFGEAALLDPDNPGGAGDTVNQKHWTGVWTQSPIAGQPRHLMWLVSGNEGVSPEDPAVQHGSSLQTLLPVRPQYSNNTLVNGNIWMVNRVVDPDQDETNLEDKIQVPKVEFDDGRAAYAWWASDESVKANVSVDDRLPDSSFNASERRAFASALPQKVEERAVSPAGADELDMGFVSAALSSDEKFRIELSEAWDLLPNIGSDVRQNYFHDVTTHSQSLLTNSRDGGLRSDLTAAFEETSQFSEFIDRHGKGHASPALVSAGGGPRAIFESMDLDGDGDGSDNRSLENPGGPAWDQLRSFYQYGDNSGGAVNMTTQTDTRSGVYPVITRFQLGFQGAWYPITAAPGSPEWGARMYILPSVEFWNPYNVSINVPVTWMRITTDRSFDYTDFMAFSRFYHDDGGGIVTLLGALRPVFSGAASIYPLAFEIESFTLAPGESRVFSPAENRVMQPGINPAGNRLASGWRGRGFYVEGVRGTNLFDTPASSTALPNRQRFGFDNSNQEIKAMRLEWATERSAIIGVNPETNSSYANDDRIITKIQNMPLGNIGQHDPPAPALQGTVPYWVPLEVPEDSPAVAASSDLFATVVNSSFPPVVNFVYQHKYTRNADNLSVWAPQYEDQDRMRWLSSSNPRAHFISRSPFDVGAGGDNSFFYYGNASGRYDFFVPSMANASAGMGLNGYQFGVGTGIDQTVLFELPRNNRPVVSLGQLGHANLSRTHNFSRASDVLAMPGFNQVAELTFQSTATYLFPSYAPAYPLGNANSDIRIANTQTFTNWSGTQFYNGNFASFGAAPQIQRSDQTRGVHADLSYWLNDTLWDGFFLSTIPQSGEISGDTVLANSRYRIRGNPDLGALRNWDTAAAQLSVAGGFNVNSQSVEAWKALLASYFGRDVGSHSNPDSSPLARMLEPPEDAFDALNGLSDDPEAYAGFRALSEAEIDQLARNIVEVFRERAKGAYTSLGFFINRDPTAQEARHRHEGLLQQAIDPDEGVSARNINNKFREATEFVEDMSGTLGNHGDLDYGAFDAVLERFSRDLPLPSSDPSYDDGVLPNASGPMAFGVPGFLTQADLLARLGPVLQVRGDTFKVRMYGASKDPLTDVTVSEAWGEAIIQRFPEFVDSSDTAAEEMSALTPLNERFGRQYRLISFRWLGDDEV